MKKFISCITVAASVLMIFSVNASAEQNPHITQYYSSQESITVFTSEKISEQAEIRIAGVSCESKNMGDIYHNAEKYETIFLIDSSKSMQSFSDEIQTFLEECIDKKRDNEFYSIGVFASGNSPEYIVSNENNQYTLEKSLDKLSYEFDSTYIYDNLMNTISHLYTNEEPIYRRIILITDGNENSAQGITIDDVIEELNDNPVPVYTVTLQTSKKNNIENLKNISRLARKSYAEDIRISDGGDAVKPASALAASAQNVDCITVIPDSSLLDGSVKAIEISDGSMTVTADIRLAMADPEHTAAEITEMTVTEETKENTAAEIKPEKEPKGIKIRSIIAAAAIVAAVICAAIIIISVINRKKKGTEEDLLIDLESNDNTMIIGGRGGQTEILIDDEQNDSFRSVILRDIADSIRTFEVQLSAEGAVIGRSSDFSNIVIDYDKSISRKHCRIFLKNGQVYIEDLRSGNKTFLNNNEVSSPTVINNSDEIKIGRTKLKVTIK